MNKKKIASHLAKTTVALIAVIALAAMPVAPAIGAMEFAAPTDMVDSNQPDPQGQEAGEAPAEGSETAPPTSAEPEHLGGIRPMAEDPLSPTVIEKLTMKWLPSGTRQTLQDDGTLLINPNGNGVYSSEERETVTAQFEYDISGSTDHAPGTIKIKIPANFFKARTGYNDQQLRTQIQSVSLLIPQAPTNQDNEYNWTIEGGYYVITNCKTIPAADRFEGSISYTLLRPSGIIDMSLQNDLNATMTITDQGQEPVTASSNTLKGRVNTYASINNMAKKALQFYLEWQDGWGEKPADADDYYYIVWGTSARSSSTCTQPYTWSTVDNPDDGELVGYASPSAVTSYSYNSFSGSNTVAMRPSDDGVSTFVERPYRYNNSVYNVRELVRYPKSMFEDGKQHTLKNTATATVTPLDGIDSPTTQTATGTYVYKPLKFTVPQGNVKLVKTGQSIHVGAIDALKAGKPVNLGQFSTQVTATGYGQTLTPGADPTKPESYGDPERPYQVELADDYVFLLDEAGGLELGVEDYELAEIGTDAFVYDYTADITEGTYKIKSIDFPDDLTVEIYGKFAGGWTKIGTASGYRYGRAYTFEPAYAGASYRTNDGHIILPAGSGCTGMRQVTSTSKAQCSLMGSVTVSLLPSERVVKWATETEQRPETYYSPDTSLLVDNIDTARALNADGVAFSGSSAPADHAARVAALDAGQYDTAVLHAEATKHLSELVRGSDMTKTLSSSNNVSKKRVDLTYRITASEWIGYEYNDESFTLREMVEDGLLEPQESGTFYDLLPLGVDPDLSTAEAYVVSQYWGNLLTPYDDEGSQGDILKSIEAKPNWNGTGRTLVIAKVENPEHLGCQGRRDHSLELMETGFQLVFTSYYSWDSLRDYGKTLVNSAGYMTDNSTIAYGSPDDGRYASSSAYAPHSLREPGLLVDLNGDGVSGEGASTNVIYASASNTINAATTAEASLTKRIRGGEAITWVDGVRDQMVNLEAAEDYQYRLRYATGSGTSANGIILYDSIENYVPEESSSDYGAAQWRGTLESVDTSQIALKGVDAKVYYSTVESLDIARHTDLSDSVWSAEPPSDMSSVTAIAVDCRYKIDGSPFVLEENLSLVALINMTAPASESEVAKLYYADAHAYNQVYTLGNITNELGVTTADQLIHNEYTKAGLVNPLADVPVTKVWDVPAGTATPGSVNVHLLANGEDAQLSATLDNGNDWSWTFEGQPKYDENGTAIEYSVSEDLIDGYQYEVTGSVEDGFTVTNSAMQPVDVPLSLTKQITGRSFEEGDSFTFKVEAQGDAPLPDGVEPDGTVTISPSEGTTAEAALGKLSVGEPATYRYVVTEVAGDDPDIEYDAAEHELAVSVARNGNGALEATVAWDGSAEPAVFTNVYYEPAELAFAASKVLTGRALAEGEFSFELLDENGQVLQTTTNTAGGAVVFEPLSYSLADAGKTFTYVISEVEGDLGGVTYDTHEETVTVNVIKQDGKLITEAASDSDGLIFENSYNASGSIVLEATKVLEGGALAEGQFSFELLDENGAVLQTASNGADLDDDGKVSGSDEIAAIRLELGFGLSQAGSADEPAILHYTLREVDGGNAQVSYDGHEASYVVSVADNGDGTLAVELVSAQDSVFTNKVVPPAGADTQSKAPSKSAGTAKTSDSLPILPLAACALAAAAALVCSLVLMRRRDCD